MTVDFVYCIQTKQRLFVDGLNRLFDFILVFAIPLLYFLFVDSDSNTYKRITGYLKDDVKIITYVNVGLCVIAFSFSNYKSYFSRPALELLLYVGLIYGVILNFIFALYLNSFAIFFVNLPLLIIFYYQIKEHHQLIIDTKQNLTNENNFQSNIFWKILTLQMFPKLIVSTLLASLIFLIVLVILELANLNGFSLFKFL